MLLIPGAVGEHQVMVDSQDNGGNDIDMSGKRAVAALLYQQAAMLFQSNRTDEAETVLRGLLRDCPEHPFAPYLLGMIYSRRGEEGLAADYMRKAISNKPDEPDFYLLLGITLQKLKQFQDALAAYTTAARLKPDSFQAYNNIGNILGSMGRCLEAIEAYNMAASLNPDLAQIHSNRGSLLMSLGRLEDALAACDRAIMLAPDFAQAHSNRGNVLLELNRKKEAGQALRNALRLDPEMADTKFLLDALDEQQSPSHAPASYVRGLFDGYAERFDNDLVGKLRYQTPHLLADAVMSQLDTLSQDKLSILDLGCGTGLCGEAFSPLASRLVGVDLSPRMLDKARERNIYTDLVEGDILQVLDNMKDKYDLILSGDVFVYIGRLDEVFMKVSGRLSANGLFAFSVETLDSGADFQLRQTARYAHHPSYIDRLARTSKFSIESCKPRVLRYHGGEPVHGNLYVLRSMD